LKTEKDEEYNESALYIKSLIRIAIRTFCCKQLEQTRPELTNYLTFDDVLLLVTNKQKFEQYDSIRLQQFAIVGNLLKPIFNLYRLGDYTIEEFINFFCLVECNAFGHKGIGIYPPISLLNHSCLPNVAYTENGSALMLYAIRDISEGTEINSTYVNVKVSNSDRQKLLFNGWYFSCNCGACLDYTETDIYRFNLHYSCPIETCQGLLITKLPEINSTLIHTKSGRFCNSCHYEQDAPEEIF